MRPAPTTVPERRDQAAGRGRARTLALVSLGLGMVIAGATGGLLALAMRGPGGGGGLLGGPEFPRFPALGASAAAGRGPALAAQGPPPVEVTIPALGIDSLLAGLHLQPDGSLQVPSDTGQVGWYADGPSPGDRGASVLVGHLDSATGPAVFYRLSQLRPGATVRVRRAGGDTVVFRVDRTATYPRGHIPAAVFASPTTALRLITCSGGFDTADGHYTDNLVVFATRAATP